MVDADGWAAPGAAALAHGDFDGSHVYHEGATYSGIIDFGEIRGAEPTYDLGQVEFEHPGWLPLLLGGYRDVRPLAPDHERHVYLSILLIATRRLASWLARGRSLRHADIEAARLALAVLR